MNEILDVDMAAFDSGDSRARAALVDGVRRSLETGFVYTSHDLPEDLLDEAYGMLAEFFSLPHRRSRRPTRRPESHGQTGYTGLLVETAAGAELADWKEMLNWGSELPAHHPLRSRYPHRYGDQVLPERRPCLGSARSCMAFHHRVVDLQARFLRIIAVGLGCHETFFDDLLVDGPHLTRAIHYPAMHDRPLRRPRVGGRPQGHQPHHRPAPCDRRRPPAAHPGRAGPTSCRRPVTW